MNHKTAMCRGALVGALLTLSTLTAAGSPQGMCVIGEKRVTAVAGVVVQPNNIPIPDATIRLHTETYEGPVVEEVKADADGRFQLGAVAPGKYTLVVSFTYLETLYIPLRVVRQKRNDPGRELIITMNGLVGEPCGGGGIEVKGRDEKVSGGSPTLRNTNRKGAMCHLR